MQKIHKALQDSHSIMQSNHKTGWNDKKAWNSYFYAPACFTLSQASLLICIPFINGPSPALEKCIYCGTRLSTYWPMKGQSIGRRRSIVQSCRSFFIHKAWDADNLFKCLRENKVQCDHWEKKKAQSTVQQMTLPVWHVKFSEFSINFPKADDHKVQQWCQSVFVHNEKSHNSSAFAATFGPSLSVVTWSADVRSVRCPATLSEKIIFTIVQKKKHVLLSNYTVV